MLTDVGDELLVCLADQIILSVCGEAFYTAR